MARVRCMFEWVWWVWNTVDRIRFDIGLVDDIGTILQVRQDRYTTPIFVVIVFRWLDKDYRGSTGADLGDRAPRYQGDLSGCIGRERGMLGYTEKSTRTFILSETFDCDRLNSLYDYRSHRRFLLMTQTIKPSTVPLAKTWKL